MKTQLLFVVFFATVIATQIQGQTRTIVNAQNSEISDNLDLRVVASIFGDSRNLEDFERRLNDPKLRISNLDLNNDGQVDYLRVIESVQKRTHIVILQSVIDRDLYQDIATIEVEKNWNNNIHIQVVGNSFFYGQNYIYEPVFYYTPIIYANFWTPYYRPYYSNWYWNYYPNYYYTWNTYPTFRYRYNVNNCLKNYNYNHYNYASHRRSSYYSGAYNKYSSNEFEKQHPEYSFSRRNTAVSNRHELEKIRNSDTRNDIGYTQRKTESSRGNSLQRTINRRDNSQNRAEIPRQYDSQRNYPENRVETPRQAAPQRTNPSREYISSRNSSSDENSNSSRKSNRRT